MSDLTTESFLACLRRFIARRGKPTLMWSDHSTNFVGIFSRNYWNFYTPRKLTNRFLFQPRYYLAVHSWKSSSLWRIMGGCSEEPQDTHVLNSWKCQAKLWRTDNSSLTDRGMPEQSSTWYVTSLRKYSKWKQPSKNLHKGNVVVLREDGMVPTQWPIARIVETHQGKDGLVRVVTLKTKNGVHTRPATKVALLLSCEEHD